MGIAARAPRSRKAARGLFVLRAMLAAKPSKMKRARKRAYKRFRKLHPKGSTSWLTI
ncbi:hypothetical protein [Sphingomonas sp. 3-13AW]|uniref:hypothetical protein n=1 Tax=Sphingomonas sp. 3-13AW TaxID=3050450 RepID=UPI003BB5C3B4